MKTLSTAQIARVFLTHTENIKEELKELSPAERKKRKSRILSEVCKVQYIQAGIPYTPSDVADLKRQVGKELSNMRKAKQLERKKKAQEATFKPFKITPTKILEAINICRRRRDHLLPPED